MAVVGSTATLHDCVAVPLGRGVGSVIVLDGDAHVGIVTGRDVFGEPHDCDCSLSGLAVRNAMSRPLLTISPDATVHQVADRFAAEGVEHLLVVDGLEMLGVVSFSHIVGHLADSRRETVDAFLARSLRSPVSPRTTTTHPTVRTTHRAIGRTIALPTAGTAATPAPPAVQGVLGG